MVVAKNILTKDFLTDAVVSGKRSREIAKSTGINDRTIRWYFKKYQLDVPRFGLNHTVWNKGLTLKTDDRLIKIGNSVSIANKGKITHNKGKIGVYTPSKETRLKQSISLRGKQMGKNNANWKGGTSSENKRIRMSSAFKEWRTNVFIRDNYTCQECNIRGGVLHPHHIKQFAHFPDLRLDIDNGITLCETCHKKTDSWGNKKRVAIATW